MRKDILYLAAITLALSFNYAEASPPLTGTVKELWVNDGGISNAVLIKVGPTYTPSCGGGPASYLVIDLSVSGMKEAYALALSAFMAGKSVTMVGGGGCYSTYSLEKLQYIYVTGN